MNCPSRADPVFTEGYNQNPDALNADATTRADMNHVANARLQRDHRIDPANSLADDVQEVEHKAEQPVGAVALKAFDGRGSVAVGEGKANVSDVVSAGVGGGSGGGSDSGQAATWTATGRRFIQRALAILRKYAKFIGPGFMVAVAYIDPGMLLLLPLLVYFFTCIV